MFKKMVFVTVLGVAALCSPWVLAGDDARSSIHITANIPNKQFHVQPRDPEFGKDEYMYYNPLTYKFTSLRHTFDVKNTEGSVHAYIEGGASTGAVHLTNGIDIVSLRVLFNGVPLDNLPQEVVDDATSTPGTQADMRVVVANSPTRPLSPGMYNADFTVIFDAVPRINL
ncbi:CS1 type fimbrial major subunit [Pseudomonas thivervalensis]|uniref:Adhesin n=1 Tax=Pseudomonas thivervalensis TaxID=86265 RepID=A0A2Z4ZFR8_9PSED|nr:CS1 type fimbrial major subunit [Pseudomonas thivervalensis]AXA56935.1 adhesin [Pseudomonas thivervalensis]AXA62748.1 adhesin [Pseudomonas thivervalensis]